MEKVFHIPIKGFLKWLVKKIQKSIYSFIGYERVSLWKRMKQSRTLNPSTHTKLIDKRKKRMKVEVTREKDYLVGQFVLGLEDTMEEMLWVGESLIAKDECRTLKQVVGI